MRMGRVLHCHARTLRRLSLDDVQLYHTNTQMVFFGALANLDIEYFAFNFFPCSSVRDTNSARRSLKWQRYEMNTYNGTNKHRQLERMKRTTDSRS